MESFLSHPVIAVVILLGALVFFHELGHFAVGRACGIAAEIFSIGFGSTIVKFRRGHTEYRLSAIPLGGYVKFYGATPAEPVPPGVEGQEFYRAAYWRRMLTIAAGPAANFLLAAVAFAVLGGAGIPHPPAVIGDVLPGGAAEQAGVYPGDKLIAIDGNPVIRWRELESAVSKSAGRQMVWDIERDGQKIQLGMKPATVEVENVLGRKVQIGRAGVSLGIIPARVGVLSRDSWAFRGGLRTGDEVRSVACAGGAPRQTTNFGILALGLWDLAGSCRGTVDLAIVRDGKDMVISASAISLPRSGMDGSVGADPITATYGVIRSYASRLGIDDGQLVVWPDSGEKIPVPSPFLSGDRIVAFDGKKFDGIFGLRDLVLENQNPEVPVTVVRDFATQELKVPLKAFDTQQAKGRVTIYTLPVSFLAQPGEPAPVIEKYASPFSALRYGFEETGRQMVTIAGALLHLVSGEIPVKALGGPIMIAKVAGDSAKLGWQAFLTSLAMISVNLGLVNLFPIPVLDGGQMILFSVEGILRRPLSERAMEAFHKLGFICVMALVLLATYNDLSRFWKSMLTSMFGGQ